jgi:hypothetical protein
MKTRCFLIGPKSAALSGHAWIKAWMHQGRQWTQTSRTPAVLELEYLRVDDKTIAGMIFSSLLRRVRRGLLRESFGAKLHATCTAAMISGPR